MSVLKGRLESESPELFRALDRSWEIAWNEWLPALGVKSDSYNSYPHIKNLELYLDQVLLGYEPLAEKGARPFISPTEKYILLSAVLFHDIGRIPAQESGKDEHASLSEKIILDEWNQLGIQSVELARSISKICGYHDCPPEKWDRHTARLNNVVIDPYGEVRERLLGCLLILIDHLDGAFSRVLPKYIRSNRDIKAVGAFRNVVPGIYVDPFCQLIRTVLSDNLAELGIKNDESAFIYTVNSNQERQKELDKRRNPDESMPGPKTHMSNDDVSERFEAVREPGSRSPLVTGICKGGFKNHEWLVAQQLLQVDKIKDDAKWPARKLLAMIMGNVRENREALERIKDNLAANGIPIRAWVIDFREHLYNDRGEETFEPIFPQDYLSRVIEGMWKLSATVFGSSYFTYENLADDIRDPQVERVKAAVRRIGIVTVKKSAIWTGDRNWKWLIDNHPAGMKCSYTSREAVLDAIKKLKQPWPI